MVRNGFSAVVLFMCALVTTVAGLAQPAGKKLLDYHAYSAWRQIRDTHLSRDGRWLAYAQVATESDGELIVRDLAGAVAYREARGREPAFTPDGRYLVYRIAPPYADVLAAERKPDDPQSRPKNGLGILDLTAGTTTTVERVRSFALAADGATLVALFDPAPAASSAPPPKPTASPSAPKGTRRDAPASLAIRVLTNGSVATVANVSSYAVSADGSHVAYVVQTQADESIHLRDTATGSDRIVAHGEAHLATPALSRDGAALAYLSDPDAYAESAKDADEGRRPFRLMVADTRTLAVHEAFGPQAAGAAPRTFASDAHKLEFSSDGRRLAFATAAVPAPRPSSAPPRVDLDFWYARDGELPTQQRIEAKDPEHGTYLAVYDLTAQRFTQLATAAVPRVALTAGARYALGTSGVPYAKLVTYDDTYWDVYRVDVTTGARTLLLRAAKGDPPELSPGGAYAAGYDPLRRAWYALRMADGQHLWLTSPRTVRAAVEDDDHPAPPPPYGFGGWLPGDRAALIYDRYDVWMVAPGSAPVALTRGAGRASKRIYRVMRPDDDQPRSEFDGERPVWEHAPYVLSFVDDVTKASGFATLSGLEAAVPAATLSVDAALGQPLSSRDGRTVVFTESRFDEFPDLWTTPAVPGNARKVSDANPQAAQYAWGHSRLIDYTNARGERLRAILITPDGFDRHRRYPMLVYVYEKLSDGLHHYVQPASGTVVNLARYVNHGYVVLLPDIRYQIGHTTASAVDCVSAAIHNVVRMGFVDPARIGMAGHSYGGYEVNALVTHTNLFRAVESGASDSDLPSLYGGFWESGDVQQSYYERGQGRLGVPPWVQPERYVENSPLFFVDRVRAPYLRIQNDADGFVPYGQGVEFFTALRRAGKEAYMFTFIGENHALARQANKDYWTVHLDEFFDHFLLGMPTPEWMTRPGTFEDRGERDVPSMFSPATWQH